MKERSETLKRREFLKRGTKGTAVLMGLIGLRGLPMQAELKTLAGTKEAGTERSPAIQVGALLGTFGRGDLESRLEAAKACGLDCVQLSLDCAGLSDMPEEIPPELVTRIRREAKARGIALAALQGTFNMSHPDAEHRQTGLRQLRVLVEACPNLGISKIHLCTGTRDRGSMWRRHPDNNSPEAWRDMAACMRQATDIAREARVVLAFEPEVNNVVDSPQKARRLLDEIGSPFLKVTIDPANIFHAGELPRMKEQLDEAFALIGKDIALAHAKDLDHDGDAGHLAAGTGKLDYDRYVSLLQKYNFHGPLLLSRLKRGAGARLRGFPPRETGPFCARKMMERLKNRGTPRGLSALAPSRRQLIPY